MSLKEIQKKRLWDLLAQPTAPFREGFVQEEILTHLEEHEVPHFFDPHGNLLLGVSSLKEYLARLSRRSLEPLRVFIAHLDHPGFHGVAWKGTHRLQVKWHGGSPVQHLKGARLGIQTYAGFEVEGTLVSFTLASHKKAIDTAVLEIDPEDSKRLKQLPVTDLFGTWRFRSPVWQEKKNIYCRGADDLVGAFAILETAIALYGKGSSTPARKKEQDHFLGLLTRAEEVGFIGAIAHLEQQWLQKARRPVIGVSLEASRTLPGAEIGKGPVVRLGDRTTPFDASGLQVLTQVAQKVLPGKHQRRIMEGGSCEATAVTAFGLRAIGLSVPLGNYHNQGFEGGPDCLGPQGPAPEFVHEDDIEGILKLCRALLKAGLPWQDPWKKMRQNLQKRLKSSSKLLRAY